MSVSPQKRRAKAFASLMALFFIAIFASLAMAMYYQNNLEFRKSRNAAEVTSVQMAAESGLDVLLYHLTHLALPPDTTEATFCEALAAKLQQKLPGCGAVESGSEVLVSSLQLDDDRWCAARIWWVSEDECCLRVTGTDGQIDRTVGMDLGMSRKFPFVFNFGLASRGRLYLSGKSSIIGMNEAEEANIYSETESVPDPIYVEGSDVTVSGDLFVAQEEGAIVLDGSPSIGEGGQLEDHLHFGMEKQEWPKVDTSPLAALATNVIDGSTDLSASGAVYNNVRIAAGTNPTFGNDTTFNGVIYVEAPNVVTFAGHSVINGMIATEDSDQPLSSCQLQFTGTADSYGVDVLPDSESFSAVKKHTGTFILAPGFQCTFSGTFGTIKGTVAADQLTFTGTADGTIRGAVLGLEDLTTSVGGSVGICIDQSHMEEEPAGFILPLGFDPKPETYVEGS